MEKIKRLPKGHQYFFITSTGSYDYRNDHRSREDNERYNIGNYFNESQIREQLRYVKRNGFVLWWERLLKKLLDHD